MKLIQLKTIPSDNGGAISYQDLLLAKMKVHPHGINPLEMKRFALPIITKVSAAKDQVALEDAEWEFLVKRLSRNDWVSVDAAVVQFVDDIKAAPELDANKLLREQSAEG